MTVETGYSPKSYKPGSAMAAEAIPFQFADADDIVVVHIADATGIRTLLASSAYTIAGDGMAVPPTGEITATGVWPPDDLFEVARDTDPVQREQIPPHEPVPARAFERALDRRALIEQELRQRINELDEGAIGDRIARLIGVSRLAEDLGVFDGELLPAGLAIKQAIQILATAAERTNSREVDVREFIGYDFSETSSYTTQLQAAINFAALTKCWLVLPGGVTLYTGRLVLPVSDVFWKTRGGRCRLRLANGTNNDVVWGANVERAVFDSIDFDGNRANNARNIDGISSNGLHILKGSAIATLECTFTECKENGARLIGIEGYYSFRSTFSANSHNGRFCSGHIDGTAFEAFYTEYDFAFDNATDGLNFEENIFDGLVIFPRTYNNGGEHSEYVGGTGFLFYGGETVYQPRDIVVYGGRTIGNYGGGAYVVSGADITFVNPSSLNDGIVGVDDETDFGNAFAAYTNGGGAHGSTQSVRNIRFINPVARGPGKSCLFARSSTTPIAGLRVIGPDFANPSAISSNSFDAIYLADCDAPAVLDPVIVDSRGTKLMRYAVRLTATTTSVRIRYARDDVRAGLSGIFSDNSAAVRVECQWGFSMAYTMPTVAAGATSVELGIAVTGLAANDIVQVAFNQGANALALSAHASSTGTMVLTVHNRGGGSFASYSGLLRGIVHKTDLG